MSVPIAIAIHGGAGVVPRERYPAELLARYEAALHHCLDAGWQILASGGSALDAVEAANGELEDDPLFNAGRGSVLNADGRIECDAAIMAGDGRAGAVSGVHTVRNPIRLARKLLDAGRPLMLSGEGAERFADSLDLERVEEAYFITEQRVQELESAKANNQVELDKGKFGTVGAVALDAKGHLAAATSTGGMTNKLPGRVGDTPIIGAGTYARNGACAVSCTGVGELFIREVAAHEIAARMRHAGQSLQKAVYGVLHEDLLPQGGFGGIIAVDSAGALVTDFNAQSLFRGWRSGDLPPQVAIF